MSVKRSWPASSLVVLAISMLQPLMAAPLEMPFAVDSVPVMSGETPSNLKQPLLPPASTKTVLTLIPTEEPTSGDGERVVLGRGYRVADGQAVAFSSLAWSIMDDGRSSAVAEVVVPGAKGVRLALSPSTLPPGVELHLRGTVNVNEVFGPYTRERIHSERIGLFPPDDNGPYWLPVMDEAAIRLELVASKDADIRNAALEFTYATVLEESFDSALDKALRRVDPPSSCLIDINCVDTPTPPAVAVLTVTSTSGWLFHPSCMGTLLRDTGRTGEPWLVTSTLCISDSYEATNAIFSWFNRSASCDSDDIDPRWTRTYGATLLASDPTHEVALLHLSGPIPTTARTGWTATTQYAGQSVSGIGLNYETHPFRETISFGSIGSVGDSYYSVYWHDGVASESGLAYRSGAGLFNGSGELVGLLRDAHASCEAPHLADEYIRFDRVYPSFDPWLMTESWNGHRLPADSRVTFFGRVTDLGYIGMTDYSEPSPHCALVLINGEFDFSCDGNGHYEITAPLDASGKATVMVFAQGHRPYRRVILPQTTEQPFDVWLDSASDYSEKPSLTRLTVLNVPEAPADWVRFSGRVENLDKQPLCALVLANGQHVFSCDDPGEFELTVPRDAEGNITLFLFADNLTPYRYTFTPPSAPLNAQPVSGR